MKLLRWVDAPGRSFGMGQQGLWEGYLLAERKPRVRIAASQSRSSVRDVLVVVYDVLVVASAEEEWIAVHWELDEAKQFAERLVANLPELVLLAAAQCHEEEKEKG